MAGQAVRVVNVSVDEGLFSSVGRACATSGIEAVGKRAHWLDSMRQWALAPLAISLRLALTPPEEAAGAPLRGRVPNFLQEGALPDH
jgi:hypothetical protein